MRMLARSAAAVLVLVLPVTPAAAQTPFYQGKQLKLLVGFPPGGGSDLFARVIADGLARHIEGKPAVVVQNQPGAGSVIAMNNYANRVARDGTTVLSGTGQLLIRLLRARWCAREDLRPAGAGRDPDGADYLCLALDR